MRILFIITLTACLFYISQAQAHDKEQWITKKDCDTQIMLERFLDIFEGYLREREDKRRKCWLQSPEYRNKDCPPLYVQPMTNETD
tara:strand:+ start:162 stop:419 length:258 start_codon:yes stop_codon:yes gene_type:complete